MHAYRPGQARQVPAIVPGVPRRERTPAACLAHRVPRTPRVSKDSGARAYLTARFLAAPKSSAGGAEQREQVLARSDPQPPPVASSNASSTTRRPGCGRAQRAPPKPCSVLGQAPHSRLGPCISTPSRSRSPSRQERVSQRLGHGSHQGIFVPKE